MTPRSTSRESTVLVSSGKFIHPFHNPFHPLSLMRLKASGNLSDQKLRTTQSLCISDPLDPLTFINFSAQQKGAAADQVET
jgi:hypothetical protein